MTYVHSSTQNNRKKENHLIGSSHCLTPCMFDTLPVSSPRISMVMAYSPANVFQPPKSVLGTMVRVDQVHQLGRYEYFREKAWHCSQVLKGYTETVKYT